MTENCPKNQFNFLLMAFDKVFQKKHRREKRRARDRRRDSLKGMRKTLKNRKETHEPYVCANVLYVFYKACLRFDVYILPVLTLLSVSVWTLFMQNGVT